MLRVIWINLMQNKFKVMLTSLGIIVGAVTIVLVIAIGQGGEAEIAKRFGDLSAATIYINPDHAKLMQASRDPAELERLTRETLETIMEENPYLKSSMLMLQTMMEATIGTNTDFIDIAAVTPEYGTVSNLRIAVGDNITEEDLDNQERVAVIGNKLARKYFGTPENAIGCTIELRNQTFTIIGVLERKGDGMQSLRPDDTVFLPYTSAMQYILSDFMIPQAVVLARDVDSVDRAIARIKSTLDYVMDDSSLYMLEDAGSRMEAALGSAKTMSMLLISVAVIVFVVGGIGIMNVLFVSIKERTKEIGILKALGSARRDILLQFLLESVGISLFGGIAGVFVSLICLPFMQYTDIPVLFTADGLMLALFFSVLTGTIFGFYPAYKASRLLPIDALNYE